MTQLEKLNDYLWRAYEKVIPPNTSAPLAFIVRSKTEETAMQVAAALKRQECQVVEISKRRWPFGRRWQVVARSAPVPLDRTTIQGWSQQLTQSVQDTDAVFTHWVPLLPGA